MACLHSCASHMCKSSWHSQRQSQTPRVLRQHNWRLISAILRLELISAVQCYCRFQFHLFLQLLFSRLWVDQCYKWYSFLCAVFRFRWWWVLVCVSGIMIHNWAGHQWQRQLPNDDLIGVPSSPFVNSRTGRVQKRAAGLAGLHSTVRLWAVRVGFALLVLQCSADWHS
jgi:hypothetical protein